MVYPDMNRCPQNDDECSDYFYALIGRVKGDPATNWEQVMTAQYPWKGKLLTIPRGIGPGIQQQPGAPFFGLTQNLDSSNHPQGRSYWPTAQADGNGFFTRAMQYLDGPQSSLVWAYYHFAGHAYSPLEPAGGSIEPGPVPPTLEARVTKLEHDMVALAEAMQLTNTALADLQQKVAEVDATAIHNSEGISISTSDWQHYLNAVNGGGGDINAMVTDPNDPHAIVYVWRRIPAGAGRSISWLSSPPHPRRRKLLAFDDNGE